MQRIKSIETAGRVAMAGIVVCVVFNSAAVAQTPSEDLMAGPPKGPWRRLFLDAMVVENQQGLNRVFHAAEKHPANPVLKRDKPWEYIDYRGGPFMYGTVMWDQGKLRMWYMCYGGKFRNCYAESTDGLTWTKPELGLIDFNGSKANNLWSTTCRDPNEKPPFPDREECHNPSVIRRDWDPDPARRYVLYTHRANYRKSRAAFSADGLRWTWVPEAPDKGLFHSGDVQNYFFDPYQNRFAATWKSGNRRGRAAGVAVSTGPDGLTWTKPVEGPVMVADDLDPDASQVYGMPTFPYQGMYIGLRWVFSSRWFKYGQYTDQRMHDVEKDSPCNMDVQLAWSWDLINWTLTPERKPIIPRGKPGEFDAGMIWTSRAPVVMGDKLYLYYGGIDGNHMEFYRSKMNIGLAVFRLDGFCSMRVGEREGWLISRREPLRVPRVTINAKTSAAGHVVAEILDVDNRPLPGFTRDDCVPFSGDSTNHVLTWKTEKLPESHLAGDKKLRFWLKEADLYSYLPELEGESGKP